MGANRKEKRENRKQNSESELLAEALVAVAVAVAFCTRTEQRRRCKVVQSGARRLLERQLERAKEPGESKRRYIFHSMPKQSEALPN